MQSHVVFVAVRQLAAKWLAVVVVVAAGIAPAAWAEDTRAVYALTPKETLDIMNKLARQNFAARYITQISPGVGISVHTQFMLDGWDTDIYIQEVEFNLMPDKVIHGVTLSTRSGGTSFLTGRLINDSFLGKLQRTLENSSKTYVVAESRIRDIDPAEADSDSGSDDRGSGGHGNKSAPVYTGTGFAVLDGTYIVTAAHVTEGGKTVSAQCGTEATQSATIIATDPANDIALLRVERAVAYRMSLAEDGHLQTGDKVFTVGFPVPDLLGPEPKYSEGVVSALSGIRGAANVLQMTTPVQPGNSGGPVVDADGHIVGVVDAQAAALTFYKGAGALPQNINWAVKSSYVRPLLQQYAGGTAAIKAGKETLSPIELTKRAACFLKVTG